MSIGFRVFTQRELPTADVIDGFKTIPAANIADCMGRLSAMNCRIRRMTAPAEHLMMHKALNMIKPGDILIVSNEGDSSQSLMGEIMVAYAKSQGIAGIVLDGPMRDLDTIYAMGVPVYATGHTPGGPFKEGPGEVNVPVACGNIHVMPGDIIVGDSDGVIVIPKHDAAKLLEEARKFSANDHAKLVAAQTGKADRSWVDKALAAKGCETIDAVYPG